MNLNLFGGVPQGSHLEPLFLLLADINFKNSKPFFEKGIHRNYNTTSTIKCADVGIGIKFCHNYQ